MAAIEHKKNTARYLAIPMVDSTTPANFKTGVSPADEAYYKDGAGAWTSLAITDTFAEIGTTGVYEIDLTAAEMNHDQILIKVTASGAADSMVMFDCRDQDVDDLATQASVDTIDGIVDDILLDTAEIGTAGAGLTAVPWNASWDAEVQSECDDALTAFWTSPGTLVDLVWDEDVVAAHTTADTAGKKLADAGGAADPWATSLPGAYGAGTAGYILGNDVLVGGDLPTNFADLAITSTTGRVTVGTIATDAITADACAADFIGASELASSAASEIADLIAADWVAGDASPLAIVAALKADAQWSNLATIASNVSSVKTFTDASTAQTGDVYAALPTNFSSTVISGSGAVDCLVQGFINNTIAETTADNIAANFETFWDNGDATSTKTVDDVGSSAQVVLPALSTPAANSLTIRQGDDYTGNYSQTVSITSATSLAGDNVIVAVKKGTDTEYAWRFPIEGTAPNHTFEFDLPGTETDDIVAGTYDMLIKHEESAGVEHTLNVGDFVVLPFNTADTIVNG